MLRLSGSSTEYPRNQCACVRSIQLYRNSTLRCLMCACLCLYAVAGNADMPAAGMWGIGCLFDEGCWQYCLLAGYGSY